MKSTVARLHHSFSVTNDHVHVLWYFITSTPSEESGGGGEGEEKNI